MQTNTETSMNFKFLGEKKLNLQQNFKQNDKMNTNKIFIAIDQFES
jgi:hypothetical protein